MFDRYFARSASDRTEDWPYWFVADKDKGDLNVTVELIPAMRGQMPFLPRIAAERFAQYVNNGELDAGRVWIDQARHQVLERHLNV